MQHHVARVAGLAPGGAAPPFFLQSLAGSVFYAYTSEPGIERVLIADIKQLTAWYNMTNIIC